MEDKATGRQESQRQQQPFFEERLSQLQIASSHKRGAAPMAVDDDDDDAQAAKRVSRAVFTFQGQKVAVLDAASGHWPWHQQEGGAQETAGTHRASSIKDVAAAEQPLAPITPLRERPPLHGQEEAVSSLLLGTPLHVTAEELDAALAAEGDRKAPPRAKKSLARIFQAVGSSKPAPPCQAQHSSPPYSLQLTEFAQGTWKAVEETHGRGPVSGATWAHENGSTWGGWSKLTDNAGDRAHAGFSSYPPPPGFGDIHREGAIMKGHPGNKRSDPAPAGPPHVLCAGASNGIPPLPHKASSSCPKPHNNSQGSMAPPKLPAQNQDRARASASLATHVNNLRGINCSLRATSSPIWAMAPAAESSEPLAGVVKGALKNERLRVLQNISRDVYALHPSETVLPGAGHFGGTGLSAQ